MTKSSIRTIIILLTLITASVHLVWLNLASISDKGSIDIPFTLNGLGYLGLLAAFVFNFPAGRERLVHYALMAFSAVTILAYFRFTPVIADPIGLATKTVEVLLIVFLWMHLQRD